MEIKKEVLNNLTVYYFGNPENASLSIIEADPQLQFTCEMGGDKTNIFMALWDNQTDLNFYLNAEMEALTNNMNSGIKCLHHADEFLRARYKEIYDKLVSMTDPNLKKLFIKSIANIKAALNLIKWYNENIKK